MNERWTHGTHKPQPFVQLDPKESTVSLLLGLPLPKAMPVFP